MKISSLARYAFGIAAGAALLAGCSAAGTQPSLGTGASSPVTSQGRHDQKEMLKLWAMTNRDHKVPVQHVLHSRSWMKKVPAGTPLLYVSDPGYGAVDVFDYT